MQTKSNKYLKKFKNAIYTQITLGVFIFLLDYIMRFVDPSNQLLQKMENLQMLVHPTRAIGLLLLAAGVNSLIYIMTLKKINDNENS